MNSSKANFFYRSLVFFIGICVSIAFAKSQIKLLESGSGKPVDSSSQTVYGGGGETKLNRVTDLEKSMDYIKGRLGELDDLKKRVEELEKSLSVAPKNTAPNSVSGDKKSVTETTKPQNIFIR